MTLSEWIAEHRKDLWHLRHAGLAGLREHRRRIKLASGISVGRSASAKRNSNDRSYLPITNDHRVPAWRYPSREPKRKLPVAIIADDFTREALAYEWEQIEITPKDWQRQLTQTPVELLFIESAWQGNRSAWQYHLTGTSAPRPALIELINWCKTRHIPVVFWNKEDPAHFEDFLDVARLADWVFTTDQNCIKKYQDALGHDRVGLFAFAVQEAICNPIDPGPGRDQYGMAFAGTYFTQKFPERREQMDMLFNAAIEAESDEAKFDIYSRHLGEDARYQFPDPYASHIVGRLNYQHMLSAYRAYKLFLNVNTITDSPTMCSRRLLEITASDTPVVTTPSPAVSWYLGEGAIEVANTAEATTVLQDLLACPEQRRRLTHIGQRKLWELHTFAHRVDDVLTATGTAEPLMTTPKISALIPTNRPGQFRHIVDYLASQHGVEVQPLIAPHGWKPTAEQRDYAKQRGVDVEFVKVAADWPLGKCLSALKARADGDFLAKMDDDDLYGPYYLQDLAASMRFSNADLVGKCGRYVYFEATDETIITSPRIVQRFNNFVTGASLFFTKELASQIDFQPRAKGEDTNFLLDAAEAGAVIYAADPYNYVQWRNADPTKHTFNAEGTFKHSAFVSKGLPLDQIHI